jgi:hypothetical protein
MNLGGKVEMIGLPRQAEVKFWEKDKVNLKAYR